MATPLPDLMTKKELAIIEANLEVIATVNVWFRIDNKELKELFDGLFPPALVERVNHRLSCKTSECETCASYRKETKPATSSSGVDEEPSAEVSS